MSKITADVSTRVFGTWVVKRCDDYFQNCVVLGTISSQADGWHATPAKGFALTTDSQCEPSSFSTYRAAREVLGKVLTVDEVVLSTGEVMHLIDGVLYKIRGKGGRLWPVYWSEDEENDEPAGEEYEKPWDPIASTEDFVDSSDNWSDDDWDNSSEMDPWGENDANPDY